MGPYAIAMISDGELRYSRWNRAAARPEFHLPDLIPDPR